MSHWRYTRWSWRHPILSRLLPRRLRARLIWREAMTDGLFLRSLDEGIADIEAGRVEHVDALIEDTVARWAEEASSPQRISDAEMSERDPELSHDERRPQPRKWSEIRRPVHPERRERIDAIKERMDAAELAEAWASVTSALPHGWAIHSLIAIDPLGETKDWCAIAISASGYREGDGPTPAAALLDLGRRIEEAGL